MAIRYRLGTHIERIDREDADGAHTGAGIADPNSGPTSNEPALVIIDPREADVLDVPDADAARAVRTLGRVRITFAEPYPSCFVGAVELPGIGADGAQRAQFGFLLESRRLVLVDTGQARRELMDALAGIELPENATPARALHELLRHLLKDDLLRLTELETDLAALEGSIIEDAGGRGVGAARILGHRRELMRLGNAYQQLDEMADELAQDDLAVLTARDRHLFATLDRQVERLVAKTQYLRDYAMQLIELTQVQADTRRDSTNLYLTVIASIFVPITTITGWYGMNFSNMPELSWEYGYAVVIVLSLVIIAAELAFFRWKKWL